MPNTINVITRSFKKILLATDFSAASQAAFHAALRLCASFGASLYILNVYEYANATPPESGGQLLELDSFYDEAKLSLKKLIQEGKHAGVHTEGTIGNGISHTSILKHLETETVDLVILGTRSIHGFERLVFGSTAEAVLRAAKCPVLTVGPRAAQQPLESQAKDGIVVFATDFHLTTTDALSDAASFATAMHLPLHCLHVLPRGIHDETRKGVMPIIIVEALKHLMGKLDGRLTPPVCAVTYGSEISNAVVEYARDNNAKFIVLGVRRASLIASHVPAHIAYRVITEAPCPVLTVAFPSGSDSARTQVFEDCESDATHPMMIQ
jgi:nucleotide-binding universal stress UspA family protein